MASLQGACDKLGDMELRIERGVPSDEELAAIVGVLLSRRAPAEPAAPPVSRWAAAGRPAGPPRRGPDAWRASALPR